MSSLVIVFLIVGGVLIANCTFGLYHALKRSPEVPRSTKERWYSVFFGLQAALALKTERYCNRGPREFFNVVLSVLGGTFLLVIIIGLIDRIAQAEIFVFVFGCMAVYGISVIAAILLRPHVINSSR